jgi:hypothetical protein
MSDDATVEFIQSIECPPNFSDLDPLECHVEADLNNECM